MKQHRKPKSRGRNRLGLRKKVLAEYRDRGYRDGELRHLGVVPKGVSGYQPPAEMPELVSPVSIHRAFGIDTRIIPRFPLQKTEAVDYHPDTKRYKRCIANFRYLAKKGVLRAG